MKVSTILSYATFSLVLVFSTTLFATDVPAGKQNPRITLTTATLSKAAKLPPVIKINTADVDMTTTLVDTNMQTAKTAGQNISLDSGEIAKLLPMLEQSISIYRNKVNECRNKSYTTEDQKKANCTDDLTIAECSKRLFSSCIFKEANKVVGNSLKLITAAKKTEADANELEKSVRYINNHNTQYAH